MPYQPIRLSVPITPVPTVTVNDITVIVPPITAYNSPVFASAVLHDGVGGVITGVSGFWSTDADPDVAVIDEVTGELTAFSDGTFDVIYTYGNVSGLASVTVFITVVTTIEDVIAAFTAMTPQTTDETLPAPYAAYNVPTLLAVIKAGRGHSTASGRKSFVAPIYNATGVSDLGIYPRASGPGLFFDASAGLLRTNGESAYLGGASGYSQALNPKDGISILVLSTVPTTPKDEFFYKYQSQPAASTAFRSGAHPDYPSIYQFYIGGPSNKIGYKYPRDGATLMSRGIQILPPTTGLNSLPQSLIQIIGGRHYTSGISQMGGLTPDEPGIFDLGAEEGSSNVPDLGYNTIFVWKGLLTSDLRRIIMNYCETEGEPAQTRPIVNFTTNSIGEMCQTYMDMPTYFALDGLDINQWGRSGAHWGSLPTDISPDISLTGRYPFTRGRLAPAESRIIIDILFEFVNSRDDDVSHWPANEADNVAALDTLAARCQAAGGFVCASTPYRFQATNDMLVWTDAITSLVKGTLVPGNLGRYGSVASVMDWNKFNVIPSNTATLTDGIHPTQDFAVNYLVPEAKRAALARVATVPTGVATDMTFSPVNLTLDVPTGPGVATDMTFSPLNLTLDVP